MTLELENTINQSLIDQRTLTVREINEVISQTIAEFFTDDVWVKGEVQRLRFHTSGHIYFDLVDSSSRSSSVIPVTLLKWNASNIKADLREILVEDREVRIKARPDYYAPYGKMSLAASDVDTTFTLGKIAIARRELIEKLMEEGILDSNSKVELENFVTKIALITSVDSAAYHDVIDQFRNSGIGFNIKAVNSLMQGTGSVDSVVSALKTADKLDVDVILLCRGGGAKSDLATFDHEKVVRAITKLNKPLFCGLGHQIDVSVSDIAAHSSLKTPTACAQTLIEHTKSAYEQAVDLVEAVNNHAMDVIGAQDMQLAQITAALSDVNNILERSSEILSNYNDVLHSGSERIIEDNENKLTSLKKLTKALDPMRVIERGFSLVYDESGKIVKSVKQTSMGEKLKVKFIDGDIDAEVLSSRNIKDSYDTN